MHKQNSISPCSKILAIFPLASPFHIHTATEASYTLSHHSAIKHNNIRLWTPVYGIRMLRKGTKSACRAGEEYQQPPGAT